VFSLSILLKADLHFIFFIAELKYFNFWLVYNFIYTYSMPLDNLELMWSRFFWYTEETFPSLPILCLSLSFNSFANLLNLDWFFLFFDPVVVKSAVAESLRFFFWGCMSILYKFTFIMNYLSTIFLHLPDKSMTEESL
jgi:hypothetical protein